MADFTIPQDFEEDPSAKVLVHCRDGIGGGRRFLRLPCIGEHIIPSHGAGVYRVRAVVHIAFPATFGAEIWCTKADFGEVIGRTEPEAP